MRCLTFGDKVNATHKFVRIEQTVEDKRGRRNSWKIWDRDPCNITDGIFLGYRTLYNGIRTWWEYETGWVFSPKKHFKVALVCPSEKHNPVYVPLDCIELPEDL